MSATGIGLLLALSAIIALLLMRSARQQRLLQRSKVRFQRTAETMPLVLYDYLIDPHGRNRFVYVNHRSRDTLGLEAQALMGDPDCLSRLIHPDDLSRLQEVDAKAKKEGRVFRTEFRITTPSGEQKWLQVESKPNPGRPGEPEIWSGYILDISERKTQQESLERQVRQRTTQLRAMAMELTATEERERQAIAQELHDGLSQTLAIAKFKLSALDPPYPDSPRRDYFEETLRAVEGLIDAADQMARSVSRQLSPPVLHKLGLLPALEWLADEMQLTFGLQVSVVDNGVPQHLDKVVLNPVFRAARELLINVARHAQVGVAVLTVQQVEASLVLSVTDAGVGFDRPTHSIPAASGRFGLFSMHERIGFIGGDVQIDSNPGDGTVVVITVPLATQRG